MVKEGHKCNIKRVVRLM
nr:hypothetical protein [Halanaerobium hydrogeniformans]